MKKVFVMILSVVLVISVLSGCVDFNAYKRPDNYPNTKWVSKNPDIYIDVLSYSNEFGEFVTSVGELTTVTGEKIDVEWVFGPGVKIEFFPYIPEREGFDDADAILRGSCKFSSTKLVISVDEIVREDLIDPSVKEIIFIKEDIPQ